MLPAGLNLALMATGYVLVMGCLALGLRLSRARGGRRRPGAGRDPGARRPDTRRGWPGLVRRVAGTAIGGYMLLMAVVVGYYEGVAHLGGGFLAAAFTENLLLLGLTVPAFLLVSGLRARFSRTSRPGPSRGG